MNRSAESTSALPAWGKWQGEDRFHCLEHHCADVAACFEAILADPVPRRRFAVAAGQDPLHPTTLARLTVLAFLRDFAKINSGFQFKVRDPKDYPGRPPPRMSHVKEAFLCMEQDEICRGLGFDEIVNWGEGGASALLIASLFPVLAGIVRTVGELSSPDALRRAVSPMAHASHMSLVELQDWALADLAVTATKAASLLK